MSLQFAFSRFRIYPPLKYVLIAALCGWATYVQLTYRVPSRVVFLLVTNIGAVLGVLHIIFLVNHFVTRLATDHPFRATLRQVEWWANLVVRVHVYLSLFLYANAKLDRTLPVEHQSVVSSIVKSDSDMFGRWPVVWINLTSWDDAKRSERLVLTGSERDTLWGGEKVLVKVHAGYFRIAWVSSVEQDSEYYAKQALNQLPTASLAWKQLINFYLQRDKSAQAIEAGNRYMQYYPQDYRFIRSIGGTLGAGGQYKDALPFLEHALKRHASYSDYQQLGWTLSYQGNKQRAAEVLEASIPLAPDDWEAYYHLGYVYSDLGRPVDALKMFQEVLKRQVHFPEVETQIAELKKYTEVPSAKTRQTPAPNTQ